MEDKELYDFFKSRKQSFDEAPGDALWAKIENGLNETPQAVAHKGGLSPLKKLLLLPVVGIVAAIAWMVVYSPETGEGSAKQKDAGEVNNEKTETKIVEGTDVHNKYRHTDTTKKIIPAATQSGHVITSTEAPAPAATVPATSKTESVKTEAITSAVPTTSMQEVQHKEINNTTNLRVTDTPASKPGTTFSKQLISKDSLNPEVISFRADSSKIKLAEPALEITAVYSSSVRQGAANEVLITPADSLGSDLKVIQTDTKTEPGRITITIKQALTDAQFNSFTEKVKKEKAHKPGTMIIITAPGRKPFRYKVPKPVGELGP